MKIVILMVTALALQISADDCKGKKRVTLKKGVQMRCKNGEWEPVIRRSALASKPCEDNSDLAANGTCDANRGHCSQFTVKGAEMDQSCPGTCQYCDGCRCQDSHQWHQYCPFWRDYCHNPGVLGSWMTENCKKTCGQCKCSCCSYQGKQHALGSRIMLPQQCGVLECQESLIADFSPPILGAAQHNISHPEELTLNFVSLHEGADCCVLPENVKRSDGTEFDKNTMVAEGWGGSLQMRMGSVNAFCCHGSLSVALNDIANDQASSLSPPPTPKKTASLTTSTSTDSRISTTSTSATVTVRSSTSPSLGILIAGGYEAFQSTELFLPKTGKTCSLADLPDGSRAEHSLDQLTDAGDVVLCGGLSYTAAPKSCIKFDMSSPSGEWTKYAATTDRRWWHSSWVSSAGLVLMGGHGAPATSEIVNGGRSFGLIHNTYMSCAIEVNNTLVISGGSGSFNAVTEYTLEGFLKNLPKLSEGRYHHGCGSYRNMLVVAGGRSSTHAVLSSTEYIILGSSATSWTSGLPLPRTIYGMASVNLDTIVLIGGRDGSNVPRAEILTYEENGTWIQVGELQMARYHGGATKITDIGDLDITGCQ